MKSTIDAMNWLPNDVARCPGLVAYTYKHGNSMRSVISVQCVECLRRTAPASGERVQHMMPPPFDGDCPQRIA